MSRVGNSPITIPAGVEVTASDGMVMAKGAKGALSMALPSAIMVEIADKIVQVKPMKKDIAGRALWGTIRANINNMVQGVSVGFTRVLEINGVGYRAAMQGSQLQLNLGYSHPVLMDVPAGLSVKLDGNTRIEVAGSDKQRVGQFAAEIRSKRPPEPFKGKGVKYADEHIVRKEGKKK